MAVPKKIGKKAADSEDDLDDDLSTDQNDLATADDDDDFDAPLDDLEYDNLGDYSDDEDDF